MPRFPMKIANVANGVGQRESVALFPVNGGRFFVQPQCRITLLHVALDLSEGFESLRQASGVSVAAEGDSFDQIPMRIPQTAFTPRGSGSPQERHSFLSHRSSSSTV
jgi:hypothetical protein